MHTCSVESGVLIGGYIMTVTTWAPKTVGLETFQGLFIGKIFSFTSIFSLFGAANCWNRSFSDFICPYFWPFL